MKIYISFYESANYTSEHVENVVNQYHAENDIDFFDEYPENFMNKVSNIGLELQNVLVEYYFNGADNAVILTGFDLDLERFEFKLIPNI